MRLTCPRCGAQYEIPEAVIPTGGREVECSACGNVWHQPAPGAAMPQGEIAAKSPDRAEVAAPTPAEPALPAEPPRLNRKLDDDVLAILREEAERELSARAREAKSAAGPDHNPVSILTNTTQPGPDAPKTAAQEIGFDWPVSTVILPGEPLDMTTAASASVPATSAAPVGAKPTPGPAPEPKPNPARHPEAEPDPVAPPPQPADPAAEVPITEPVASITEPETQGTSNDADTPAAPPGPRLPDAARLAATLTRPLPQAAPTPPAAPPLTEASVATGGTMRPAQVPALRKPTQGGGYAAGFGLAAMLALALLASYALAPRVEPGSGAGPLAEWRDSMDRARLWLHDLVGGAPDA